MSHAHVVRRPLMVDEEDSPLGPLTILSKYDRFSPDDTMYLKKDVVVATTEVTPETVEYYVTSVIYNKRFLDHMHRRSVSMPNESMKRVLDVPPNIGSAKDYALLMMPTSETKH